jgi:hypothetical protein
VIVLSEPSGLISIGRNGVLVSPGANEHQFLHLVPPWLDYAAVIPKGSIVLLVAAQSSPGAAPTILRPVPHQLPQPAHRLLPLASHPDCYYPSTCLGGASTGVLGGASTGVTCRTNTTRRTSASPTGPNRGATTSSATSCTSASHTRKLHSNAQQRHARRRRPGNDHRAPPLERVSTCRSITRPRHTHLAVSRTARARRSSPSRSVGRHLATPSG